MTLVTLTLASENDKGFTIRTSQFPNLKFDAQVFRYYLEIKGMILAVPMVLSRGGDTLYTGALHPYVRALLQVHVGFPSVGDPLTVEANLGKQIISID